MEKRTYFSKEASESHYVEISRLMGIAIFKENDIYEFAKAVLTIKRGHDEFRIRNGGHKGKTYPTIHGLARMFASTADIHFPEKYVLDILMQHGFTGREALTENEQN